MEGVVAAHGRRTTYRVEHGALVVVDTGGERRIDLAAIRRVRLVMLEDATFCELSLADGGTLSVVNDDKASRGAYAQILVALHEQLAARGDVTFVRGSWVLVAVLGAIGLAVCGVGLAITQGWFAVPHGLESKATLVTILGAVTAVAGPLLMWRSRPRPYDPRALPRDLVPD